MPGSDPERAADIMLERCSPAHHLRRRFTARGTVRRAVLYATARGVVELQGNGARVGDAVLAPGWTDYRRRIEYAAHDVTGVVRDGPNVVSAILGDGWYSGFVGFDLKRAGAHYGTHPELLCELHLEHEDGTRQIVASDESWRASAGPIRYSDLLHGEYYDARREHDGWTEPDYDDGTWPAVLTQPRDDVALVPERAQHYEALHRDVVAAFNRAYVGEDAFIEATRRPSICWRCTWTCCRRNCAQARRSASSPTSSAATGT